MSKSKAQFTFVHIPKNAGTSIKTLIEDKKVPYFEYVGHRFSQKKVKSPTIKVCIFRDPVDRFISAFYYSKKEHPKSPSHKKFDNPNELIDSLRQTDHKKHKAALAYIGNKPIHNQKRFLRNRPPHKVAGIKTKHTWVFEPQMTWYKYLLNNRTIYLDFKNLAEEFQQLINHIQLYNSNPNPSQTIKLPHQNSTRKRRTKFSIQDLSPINLQYVKKYYEQDYLYIEQIKENYTLDKQLPRVLPTPDI